MLRSACRWCGPASPTARPTISPAKVSPTPAAWLRPFGWRHGWRLRSEEEMRTVIYLLRHGATEANLAQPPRLQGRRQDLPLAEIGIRQAELTRDFLAVRPIDHCYSSPLLRAMQ